MSSLLLSKKYKLNRSGLFIKSTKGLNFEGGEYFLYALYHPESTSPNFNIEISLRTG